MLYGQIKISSVLPDVSTMTQDQIDSYNNIVDQYNENRKNTSGGIRAGSIGLGLGLSWLASRGMKAKNPEDRIDQKQTTDWAKKYLNTNKVDVAPVQDLGNAYYSKHYNYNGDVAKHEIRYDPEFNKSIAAHEIGHGMWSIPRVPFSSLLGPALLGAGGYDYGSSLGLGDGTNEGLSQFLLGGAIMTPTLVDEYMASKNARKILADNNIKPRGLTRAWSTYAAPVAVGLGALGAGYLGAKYYTDKMHELNPNWDIVLNNQNK
jgi:hypothetical protein